MCHSAIPNNWPLLFRWPECLWKRLPKHAASLLSALFRRTWIAQKDSIPARWGSVPPVREFLDQHFPSKWVGRNEPILWPPRPPDLTPLDYFLWGYDKGRVCADKPTSLKDLKMKIRQAICTITPDVLEKVTLNFQNRAGMCIAAHGGHFEWTLSEWTWTKSPKFWL